MSKKIIFLKTYPNKIGGAELSLKILREEFQKMSLPSEIFSLKAPKFLSSWLKALIFNSQSKKAKKADEIYFSYERISSSDIYFCGEGVHKIYAKTKKFSFLNPLNFVYPYLEKKCIANSKKIIAVSQLVKEQILQAYKVDENKVKVIYNSIKLAPDFDKVQAKKELCEKFNFDENALLFLFVGSGYKRKGLKEFLELLAKLDFPYQALIIGKDKREKFYKDLAEKLQVSALFLGENKEVAKFYKASDIFLFPSHFEPFGNTILESMNFKNVAITTAQAGSSELLSQEFIMKNPQDFSIIEKLKELNQNREKLRKIGEENRKLSLEFSSEKQAEKVYQELKGYL